MALSLALLCACGRGNDAVDADAQADAQTSLVPEASTKTVIDAQLNLSMPIDTSVIDPYEITSYKMQSLVPLVFESPITLDADGSPKAYLCQSWTANEDGTVTFTVRDNVLFHDGTAFDASHIAYGIERAMQSENYRYVSSYIDKYSVSDDNKQITIKPKKGVINLVLHMDFPITGMNGTIGTGPYKVDDIRAGSGMSLSVNEAWWMKQPEIKNIYAKAIEGDEAQIQSLLAGEIDVVYARGQDISAYMSSGKYLSMSLTTPSYEYIVFNTKNELMADKNLRLAIAYSLDRRTMISNAYFGNVTMSDTPMNAQSWIGSGSSSMLEQDMKKAIEYISACGFTDTEGDGFFDNGIAAESTNAPNATLSPDSTPEPISYEPIKLKIITNTDTQSSAHKEAANMIAAQLESLGLKAEVKMYEMDDLSDELEDGNFDIAVLATYLGNSVDLYDLYHSSGRLNYSGYSSSAVDSMIERHIAALDEAEYVDTAIKTQEMIIEDMPVLGIGFKNSAMLYSQDIEGIGRIDSYNIFSNIDAWRVEEDEQH
ncbi:MAG: hypothetical protein IJB92_03655 [Clostridia bacterium]|nr:hypothetical protein [Clostridia bacterium]